MVPHIDIYRYKVLRSDFSETRSAARLLGGFCAVRGVLQAGERGLERGPKALNAVWG